MSILQNVEGYSAVVSIAALVTSILGPVITCFINNRHQFKMRKLDIKEARRIDVVTTRRNTLETFMSAVGKCVANPTFENHAMLGSSYFAAYQYIPKHYWDQLDVFYLKVCDDFTDEMRKSYHDIIRVVSDLLKEEWLGCR